MIDIANDQVERLLSVLTDLLPVVGELLRYEPGELSKFSPLPHPSLSEEVRDEIRPWIESQWRAALAVVEELRGPQQCGEAGADDGLACEQA